jgi:hypothetical protein
MQILRLNGLLLLLLLLLLLPPPQMAHLPVLE